MTDSNDRFPRELARCSIAQAPAGVFWTRHTGSVLQANHRFCELLGYPEEQLRALHICDLVADWSKSRWSEQWGRFRKQDIIRYEGGLTTRLGDVTPVEISATLLSCGDEEVLYGFVQDSAGRQKGAEALMAELKASVDRFRHPVQQCAGHAAGLRFRDPYLQRQPVLATYHGLSLGGGHRLVDAGVHDRCNTREVDPRSSSDIAAHRQHPRF